MLLQTLLTLDDVPDGWYGGETYVHDAAGDDRSGDDGMLVGPGDDYCGANFDDPYRNQVDVVFYEDASDRLLIQVVSLYDSADDAELVLSQMFASMERCPEFEEIINGETALTRISRLDDPALGDQSAAFLLTSTAETFDLDVSLVAFRIDRTVSLVMHWGGAAISGPVQAWDTVGIATRAVEKMAGLREVLDSLERPTRNVV